MTVKQSRRRTRAPGPAGRAGGLQAISFGQSPGAIWHTPRPRYGLSPAGTAPRVRAVSARGTRQRGGHVDAIGDGGYCGRTGHDVARVGPHHRGSRAARGESSRVQSTARRRSPLHRPGARAPARRRVGRRGQVTSRRRVRAFPGLQGTRPQRSAWEPLARRRGTRMCAGSVPVPSPSGERPRMGRAAPSSNACTSASRDTSPPHRASSSALRAGPA